MALLHRVDDPKRRHERPEEANGCSTPGCRALHDGEGENSSDRKNKSEQDHDLVGRGEFGEFDVRISNWGHLVLG